MVNDTAYHDGGMWFVDRWWSIRNNDTFKNIHTNIHITDKEISIVKLKVTNLVTKRIVNSISKGA